MRNLRAQRNRWRAARSRRRARPIDERSVLVGRPADEDAAVSRKPGVRFERVGGPPDADREADRAALGVEHDFGHERSKQARAQATETPPGGLDRPDDALVGAPDEELCEPMEAAGA